MIKISTAAISRLRKETKAGIIDCRQALQEAGGDVEEAKRLLVKKGAKLALKKIDRETKEGIIGWYVHTDAKVGALVKLTCETDFVSRSQDFKKLGSELAMQVTAMEPKNVKDLLDQAYIRQPEKKIKDLLVETIAKIGENVKVEEFSRLQV